MWYGIIPASVVLCHTIWLENSKRERSMKGSFPPVVFRNQFEWRWAQQARTTRVTVRGRAWSFDRRTSSKRNEEGHQKQIRTGRWARAYWNHSLNVIFKFLTVCHSMNQLVYRPQKHSFPRIMVVSRIQPNGPRGMAGHQPSTPPSGLTALGRRLGLVFSHTARTIGSYPGVGAQLAARGGCRQPRRRRGSAPFRKFPVFCFPVSLSSSYFFVDVDSFHFQRVMWRWGLFRRQGFLSSDNFLLFPAYIWINNNSFSCKLRNLAARVSGLKHCCLFK